LIGVIDKSALIRALCAQLDAEIARGIESATRTREGAVHEEARPENDKDTRALEASYLARGQAQRVVDLQMALKLVTFMAVRDFGPDDAVDVSALVQLEADDETRWYLITPAGGGHKLQLGATNIDVLTPQAPLGRALIGRYVGDEVALDGSHSHAGRKREWTIAQLR
jgi:transcription elongation GreA/GreB family factor